MPHRKLIARPQAVGDLSEQDQLRLTRMPYRVKSLTDGEYVLREGDKPAGCIVVTSGFLSRQRVVSARNQISSFYIAGDMPDLPTLHLPVADCDLMQRGQFDHSRRAPFICPTDDDGLSRTYTGFLARDADTRFHLSRMG
jgi:hypothetical protein